MLGFTNVDTMFSRPDGKSLVNRDEAAQMQIIEYLVSRGTLALLECLLRDYIHLDGLCVRPTSSWHATSGAVMLSTSYRNGGQDDINTLGAFVSPSHTYICCLTYVERRLMRGIHLDWREVWKA